MFYFPQARKVWAEIPEQFMSYMESKNIVPNLPMDRPVQVRSIQHYTTNHANECSCSTSVTKMDAPINPVVPPNAVVDQRQLQPQQLPPNSPHANGTIYGLQQLKMIAELIDCNIFEYKLYGFCYLGSVQCITNKSTWLPCHAANHGM